MDTSDDPMNLLLAGAFSKGGGLLGGALRPKKEEAPAEEVPEGAEGAAEDTAQGAAPAGSVEGKK